MMHQHSQELILAPGKLLLWTHTLQFKSLPKAESTSLPLASPFCGILISWRGPKAPACLGNGTEAYDYFSALAFLKRSTNDLTLEFCGCCGTQGIVYSSPGRLAMPDSLLHLELGQLTTWPWSPCPKGCVLLSILGWVSRCRLDPSLQAGMQGLSGKEGVLGSTTGIRQWKITTCGRSVLRYWDRHPCFRVKGVEGAKCPGYFFCKRC